MANPNSVYFLFSFPLLRGPQQDAPVPGFLMHFFPYYVFSMFFTGEKFLEKHTIKSRDGRWRAIGLSLPHETLFAACAHSPTVLKEKKRE